MRNHLNRTNGCFRRFAGLEPLTCHSTSDEATPAGSRELRNGQSLAYKSNGLQGELAVDALVFEFMGLAILALCVVVLAVPSSRRPSARHISDY
jgi:hypothetical protein